MAAVAYGVLLVTLEAELAIVAETLDRLTDAEWSTPTRLAPPETDQPPWTVLELAGHLDISIGITRAVIADRRRGPATRDAADFFTFPTTDVATDFYEYAYEVVEGRTPADLRGVLPQTFSAAVQEARSAAPELVGAFPGYEPRPLLRLDDWISSRIVEAVVHGMDLTDALGRPSTATTAGIAHTATLLDNLLGRRTQPGRPGDLDDDRLWVRAAAGRDQHTDRRLPLIS